MLWIRHRIKEEREPGIATGRMNSRVEEKKGKKNESDNEAKHAPVLRT